MNKKRITIALLNWNNANETLECLYSLQNVREPQFQVLVVDNGSSDDSLFQINTFKNRINDFDVIVAQNDKNLGFAGGCNVALNWAIKNNQDYVLLLNNDTTVKQNFLEELLKHAEKHENVAFFVPSIFFQDRPSLVWFGGEAHLDWRKMHQSAISELHLKPLPQDAASRSIEFASGCAMFCRVKALQEIGGFDSDYFLYWEDVEFSLKARQYGWNIRWVPSAHIYHKVSATTKKQGVAARQYYDIRNFLLLSSKYAPQWMVLYRPVWAVGMVVKQIIKIIIRRNVDVSIGILRGVRDYYRGKFGPYNY